jgi:hypothetical protein
VGPPPPGATRELGIEAMLLSLIDIRSEGRAVNTHESSLFTGVREGKFCEVRLVGISEVRVLAFSEGR